MPKFQSVSLYEPISRYVTVLRKVYQITPKRSDMFEVKSTFVYSTYNPEAKISFGSTRMHQFRYMDKFETDTLNDPQMTLKCIAWNGLLEFICSYVRCQTIILMPLDNRQWIASTFQEGHWDDLRKLLPCSNVVLSVWIMTWVSHSHFWNLFKARKTVSMSRKLIWKVSRFFLAKMRIADKGLSTPIHKSIGPSWGHRRGLAVEGGCPETEDLGKTRGDWTTGDKGINSLLVGLSSCRSGLSGKFTGVEGENKVQQKYGI